MYITRVSGTIASKQFRSHEQLGRLLFLWGGSALRQRFDSTATAFVLAVLLLVHYLEAFTVWACSTSVETRVVEL